MDAHRGGMRWFFERSKELLGSTYLLGLVILDPYPLGGSPNRSLGHKFTCAHSQQEHT